MLLYRVLYLTGYGLTLERSQAVPPVESPPPWTSEHGETRAWRQTTGPLGQARNAVGMAVAERTWPATFTGRTRSVDHHTYFICGDGDLMEGSPMQRIVRRHFQAREADRVLRRQPHQIDGSTDLTYSDDAGTRFEARAGHVHHVADGMTLEPSCRDRRPRKAIRRGRP